MKEIDSELVSVIIPVYNVDKYLGRCVDSVLKQTYSNLEIILIDDGSEDKSGDLCDYYTETDRRVRVLHKKNGGLSDARNTGIEMAKGKYVYFVDSDDFIAMDAIGLLIESILSHDADIATHGYVHYYDEGSDGIAYNFANNTQSTLSNTDALEKLLYEENVTTSACMKLYKRQLFGENIRFPLGKIYEDLAIVYRLFAEADKIVLNSVPKYYYYERVGSTTQRSFSSKRMDGLDIAKEQLNFIDEKFPTLTAAAQYRLFAEAVYISMKMPWHKNFYKIEKEAISEVIHQYRRAVLINRKAKWSMRQRALIVFLGIRPMVLFFKARSALWRSIKRVTG